MHFKQISAFTLIELLIAISLGALLSAGIFHLCNAMMILHERQMAIAHLQEKTRALTEILRTKIQTAGDWSCVSKKPRSIIIRRYSKTQAFKKLGIIINQNTNLLQIHECTRLHDKIKYLPIDFFISVDGRNRDALFIKLSGHPREEMMIDVRDFIVTLYKMHDKKNAFRAVKIDYVLSSQYFRIPQKIDYWFHHHWIAPTDFSLYQPGIIYAALYG